MQDTAELLKNFWYVAAPSGALARGRMLPVTLLGDELILLRDEKGNVSALKDFCPHRGMPLRHGRFDGCEVECCYHGWRFDMQGTCTAIPSNIDQAQDTKKIRTGTFPAIEQDGIIWVYTGNGEPPAVPDFMKGLTFNKPFLTKKRAVMDTEETSAHLVHDVSEEGPSQADLKSKRFTEGKCFTHVTSCIFPCHIDHAVIGLMDPAHGPFVHKSWWWRTQRSIHAKTKQFAPRPFGFAMVSHKPSTNSRAYKILGGDRTTEIQFQLPGLRSEHITIGQRQVLLLTALTPVDATTTILHQFAYTNIGLMRALFPLLKIFGRSFIAQDLDIVKKQQQGLKPGHPPLMLMGDADAQALWYYRLKKEALSATIEARAFENPLRERTLSWRS